MAGKKIKGAASVGQAGASKAGQSHRSGYVRFFLLVQMVVCVVGIYGCFTMWSLKQERILTKPYFLPTERDRRIISPKGEMLKSTFGITLLQSLAAFALSTTLLALGQMWRFIHYCFTCCADPSEKSKSARMVADCATKRFGIVDIVQFLLMCLSSIFASSIGFEAMRLLPYPVVLTAKMSKKIPIIFVGFLWYGTRYSFRMLLSCAMITCGVLLFYFCSGERVGAAHQLSHPRDLLHIDLNRSWAYVQSAIANVSHTEMVGFAFLLASLIMDGFMHSTQDVLVHRRRWGGNKLMATTSGVTAIIIVCIMLCMEKYTTQITDVVRDGRARLATLGPFMEAVLAILPTANSLQAKTSVLHDYTLFTSFLTKYPEAMNDILAMSVYNAAGQIFIFRTISLFGTMAVTTMTILRKLSSIVISVFVNDHQINELQWASLALVTIGVCVEAKTSIDEAAQERCASSTVKSNGVARRKPTASSKHVTTSMPAAPVTPVVSPTTKKSVPVTPKEPSAPLPSTQKTMVKSSNGDVNSQKNSNGNDTMPAKKVQKKAKTTK